MQYHFKHSISKDGNYYAEGIEIKDCKAEADTLEELKEITKDLLDLYFDEDPDSKIFFPMPLKKEIKGKNIFTVEIDPNIMLAQTLRMLRLNQKLTIEEVTNKMGYKKIWDYLKFEKNKVVPNFNTLIKLKKVYPELDLNELAS
jgi:predicted RNase H-like HicB family nuclease